MIKCTMLVLLLLATAVAGSAASGVLGTVCSSDSDCATPLYCLGENGVKKCVQGQKLGAKCGPDPWWNCQRGLHCLGEGEKKCVPGKTMGMVCADDPWWSCQPGLHCLGKTVRKCVPGKPMGMECADDPWWSCKPPLHCLGSGGSRKCVPGKPAGMECAADPWWSCQPGLYCLGDGVKKCSPGKPLGMECRGDPWWSCRPGLTCSNGTCLKEARFGHSCAAADVACAKGLVCSGTGSKRWCVQPKKMGEACGWDAYWPCEPALRCVDHVCTQ